MGLESLDAARDEAPGEDDLASLSREALAYLVREAHDAPADDDPAMEIVGGSMSREQYVAALEELRTQMNADPAALESMLVEEGIFDRASAIMPPADWRFPNWSAELTPTPESYEVGDRRFETVGNLWGWIVNSGETKLPKVAARNRAQATQRFRWAHDRDSRFRYQLEHPNDPDTVRVALFGDFGTGLVHSRYIGRALAEEAVPYAFHLGDVYYSGRKHEYEEYFVKPLEQLTASGATRLFNLAGNHDQFSGNRWYWQDIDDRAARFQRQYPQKARSQQEGSYFILHDERYQIIGLDTNSFELGRYENPVLRRWLVDALRDGRQRGLTNILLTSEHPYDYVELTSRIAPKGRLYRDLAHATATEGEIFDEGLIDFWFWCHVHYVTFNAAAPEHGYPFLGSCIGHGGYAYGRRKRPSAAPWIRWIEEAGRFPLPARRASRHGQQRLLPRRPRSRCDDPDVQGLDGLSPLRGADGARRGRPADAARRARVRGGDRVNGPPTKVR